MALSNQDIQGISATHVGHLRKHVILCCKERAINESRVVKRKRAISESRVVKRKAGQMYGVPVSGSHLTKRGVFSKQRACREDFQRNRIEMKFSMSRRLGQQTIGGESHEQATASQSQASSSSSQVALSISPTSIDTMGLQTSQARLSDAEASQPPSLTQTPETESASSFASGGNKRRGRGPSRANCVRILPLGQTVPVDLVGGSAIGPYGQIFTTYLGVCNRVHCNLWQQNYTTLSLEKKEAIMKDLQQYFTFERSAAIDADILRHMGEMQRKRRAHLKRKYYEGRSFEEACNNLPPIYDSNQWRHMCEIWSREDHKRISRRNKSNRSHLSMPYRRGRTNIHQLKSDFLKKEGRPPTRPEIFQMTQTHPQADGSIMWSNKQSRQMMDNMTRLIAPTSSSNSSDVSAPPTALAPEEAFIQVFGRDRPGRIRCGGRGQTLTSWYGMSKESSSSSTYQHFIEKQSQQQSQIERMQKIIEDQQQQLAAQALMQAQMEQRIKARMEQWMQVQIGRRMQEFFATRHGTQTAPPKDGGWRDVSDRRDEDDTDEDEEEFSADD